MRSLLIILSATCFFTCRPSLGQQTNDGPTNEKAQKSYKSALQELHERKEEWALDDFKKADKQDGGHCLACQKQMIKYGVRLGDWKAAELAAEELLNEARDNRETALGHYQYAQVLLVEASQKHKEDLYTHAHEEAAKAVASYSNFPEAILLDGKALANLRQDDAAKAQFERFLKIRSPDSPDYRRAQRFISQPDWRAPEWLRHSLSPQRTVSAFPWMICRARSYC